MLFMKKLKLRLEPKIKVDDDKDNYKDEENEYLNNDANVKVKVKIDKLTKWKNKICENICYYFRCFKKDKDPDYLASRKLYDHYTESSETDLLNDPFDQILNREDIIY